MFAKSKNKKSEICDPSQEPRSPVRRCYVKSINLAQFAVSSDFVPLLTMSPDFLKDFQKKNSHNRPNGFKRQTFHVRR